MIEKSIDDYYTLSEIVEDDIIIVALLISICRLKVDNKILRNLENLIPAKYSKELDRLLELDTKTIRGLKMILKGIADEWKISQDVKVVNKQINLLDFIEKE